LTSTLAVDGELVERGAVPADAGGLCQLADRLLAHDERDWQLSSR
jgi:hypothetical protein